MVDVAHESDDGWPGFEIGRDHRLGLGRLDNLDRRMHLAGALFPLFNLEGEAELRAKLARDIVLQRLVGLGEDVHLHQMMDELERLQPKLRRKILDDDGRLDDDDFFAQLLRRDFSIVGRGP